MKGRMALLGVGRGVVVVRMLAFLAFLAFLPMKPIQT